MTTPIEGREGRKKTQPPYLFPGYVSTQKRAPLKPLILLPENSSSVFRPVFGDDFIRPTDVDMTRQHAGDPLGERIIISGSVVDEDGYPVSGALIELWQANAAGRYRHQLVNHPAQPDPNFTSS